MAKLFENIETGNKKKDGLIKGISAFLLVVLLVGVAFFHNHKTRDSYAEDATSSGMMVHVKGAVENSGVYTVPFGTRVLDLGEYAGGFAPDADLDGVNLAEYVEDGDEIYIPYKGSSEKGGFDLNKVTYDELVKNVEGIGSTSAGRIIEYREKNGGFKSVSELKGILNESTYEKVREKFYIGE